MQWKLKLGLLVSVCALTACEGINSIDGTLFTNQALNITDMKGKPQSLPAQKSYSSTLKMNEKGAQLVISKGLLSADVSFLLPKPTKDQLGVFTVAAAESKQSFDTQGDIEISISQVNASHSESCIYSYHMERVCVRVADKDRDGRDHDGDKRDGRDGDHRGGDDDHDHMRCHMERVADYGTQWVNQVNEVTDKNVSLSLTDTVSQARLASFSGSYRVSTTIVSRDAQACLR